MVKPLKPEVPVKIMDRFLIGGPLTLRGFNLKGCGPHEDGMCVYWFNIKVTTKFTLEICLWDNNIDFRSFLTFIVIFVAFVTVHVISIITQLTLTSLASKM